MHKYHGVKSSAKTGKSSEAKVINLSIDCGGGFYKSSFSGAQNCVAVAKKANGEVHVRDTKDPLKQSLIFTRPEWKAFVDGVKNNEFDNL